MTDALGQTRHAIDRLTDSAAILILNLHQIGSKSDRLYSPLDEKVFRRFIQYIASVGDFIKIENVGAPTRNGRLRVVLSFDDGFRDFVECAMPIITSFGIPVNLNVIPNCLITGEPPVNIKIMEVAKTSAGDPDVVALIKNRLGCDASNDIGLHRSILSKQIRDLNALGDELQSITAPVTIPMMSVDDLAALDDIVELGCHSYEHACMPNETDEYFENDLRECRRFFENNLGFQPKIYAFPFGKCQQRHISSLQAMAFEQILGVSEKVYMGGEIIDRITAYGDTLSSMKHVALVRPAGMLP